MYKGLLALRMSRRARDASVPRSRLRRAKAVTLCWNRKGVAADGLTLRVIIDVKHGIGLFPAAYWHHTSIAQWRERMARDAKALKEQDGGVHVRSNAPGEWMN